MLSDTTTCIVCKIRDKGVALAEQYLSTSSAFSFLPATSPLVACRLDASNANAPHAYTLLARAISAKWPSRPIPVTSRTLPVACTKHSHCRACKMFVMNNPQCDRRRLFPILSRYHGDPEAIPQLVLLK